MKPKRILEVSRSRKREAARGFPLRGATAIVTGAGTGIGRELARALAREGANLVCAGRRLEPVEETARLISSAGGRALAVSADVTDRALVSELVRRALEEFGQIDLLFNNAGSFQAVGPAWEADPDVWWQDVTINLRGPVLCSSAVLP